MRLTKRYVTRLAAAALAGLLAIVPACAGDSFSASTTGGFGRLLFDMTPLAHVQAQVTGSVLTLAFDRKPAITATAIAQALPSYIASARMDPDGKTFRFALTEQVRVHTSTSTDQSPSIYYPRVSAARRQTCRRLRRPRHRRSTSPSCRPSPCAPAPITISRAWCSTGRITCPMRCFPAPASSPFASKRK